MAPGKLIAMSSPKPGVIYALDDQGRLYTIANMSSGKWSMTEILYPWSPGQMAVQLHNPPETQYVALTKAGEAALANEDYILGFGPKPGDDHA